MGGVERGGWDVMVAVAARGAETCMEAPHSVR